MKAAPTAIAPVKVTQNNESCTAKTCPRRASSTSVCMPTSAHSLITCPAMPRPNAEASRMGMYKPEAISCRATAPPSAIPRVRPRPNRRSRAGVETVPRNEPMPVHARNNAAAPIPANTDSLLRTRTRTSSVLTPNTMRCAARPMSASKTDGVPTMVRAPCSHPVATA
ncbi:Uncharacterised protein [Mycobacteroides abscessus subsp. abscessus]|nr:Uncharacterised protein [Mycobacteroides abscessus subsp. abscessus]